MAANIAVQTVQLQHMRESLERIEQSLGSHVTRNEWEMRNGYVDGQFILHAADVASLRKTVSDNQERMENRRAPWWAVGSLVVAGIVLVWQVIGPAIIALP